MATGRPDLARRLFGKKSPRRCAATIAVCARDVRRLRRGRRSSRATVGSLSRMSPQPPRTRSCRAPSPPELGFLVRPRRAHGVAGRSPAARAQRHAVETLTPASAAASRRPLPPAMPTSVARAPPRAGAGADAGSTRRAAARRLTPNFAAACVGEAPAANAWRTASRASGLSLRARWLCRPRRWSSGSRSRR